VADDAPPEETHPWDPSVAATQVRVSPDESIEVSREVLFASITPEAEGRYQLLTELGRGGIGRVVVGFDLHLGRTVACKELMLAYSATGLSGSERDPSVLRFLREARVTGQLEHPSIVPIYELGHRADGTLYYTMKRVRGSTLGHRLSMAETLADRLSFLPSLLDVANAIAYAHSRGVIHRDIKPDNVMLGRYGETIVVDWGLAMPVTRDERFRQSGENTLMPRSGGSSGTSSSLGAGTPAYMSPEQLFHGKQIDHRGDLWSVGVVAYYALTPLRRPLIRAWVTLTYPLGWLLSHIVLALVYHGVFTPIGVIQRAFGRDAMRRRFDPGAESYWIERDPKRDAKSYFKQS